MMYNGVAHRYYAREITAPMGGFRAAWSTLGQAPQNLNCFDSNGLAVSCLDPNCAGGPCGGQVQTPPAPVAGAPTGSILLYQGSWQITLHQVDPSKNLVTDVNQILTIVSQNLPGLQILGAPQTGDFSNVSAYIGLAQSFQVSLNLQVTGPGFGSPGDAKSIVDHAYYIATGTMPVSSSISLVSTPSAAGAPGGYNLPPGATPPAAVPSSWLSSLFSSTSSAAAGAASQSMSAWFQQNGMLMFGILVAAMVVPQLIQGRR